MACMQHSGRLRASYEAVIAQVHRLLDSGDWWKPRQLVDTETGEVRETVYLPEDTWSAQTALHWCVQLLVQLLAAVPLGGVVPAIFRGLRFGRGRESISRTTEPATPHYKPGARAKPLRGGASALEDQDWLPNLARMGEKLFGRQPNLPATG